MNKRNGIEVKEVVREGSETTGHIYPLPFPQNEPDGCTLTLGSCEQRAPVTLRDSDDANGGVEDTGAVEDGMFGIKGGGCGVLDGPFVLGVVAREHLQADWLRFTAPQQQKNS